MVVEHAHGLRQRRGPNAKSSLHKAHLAPDAGLQAPGASLSFAQGSHDFESLDRGIGRGDRFETAHRLDQYLELSVIGLDHVIEILHLPVGRLPVQLSFALQFGDRCTIARRFVGIERGRLFPGHCCKVSDEAAFCLIQRPYISKTLLTRRISPRGSP